MEIRRVYINYSERLVLPEDSVFFPAILENGAIIAHVLIGDSNKTKTYYIRSIQENVTFIENHISLQALGSVDNYGSIQYVFAMEVKND